MSIYDRARDALNTWRNGTEHEKDNAAIELSSNSAVHSDALVRVAALADHLDETGDKLAQFADTVDGPACAALRTQAGMKHEDAALIREALEGDQG